MSSRKCRPSIILNTNTRNTLFGPGGNRMVPHTIRILQKGLQLRSDEYDEWANREHGFLHLACFLSAVLVVLSASKRVVPS